MKIIRHLKPLGYNCFDEIKQSLGWVQELGDAEKLGQLVAVES